jgi:hypothetical protein
VDRNRSKPLPTLEGLQPNRIEPVLFGSVAPKRPVSTGFTTNFYSIIKFYYIPHKFSYITLRAGARSGGVSLIERNKEKKTVQRTKENKKKKENKKYPTLSRL